MEISIDNIIAIAGLLLGGSGGALFTWYWQRKKAKADAKSAEAQAEQAKFEAMQANAQLTKEIQESYRQLTADLKANLETQQQYNDEQKQYIEELKEDRRHLREERDELRQRIDDTDVKVRELQQTVERNNSLLAWMRPMLCGKRECTDRMAVTSEDMAVATKKRGGRQHADKD